MIVTVMTICSQSSTRLIEPLRSRCCMIRVAGPDVGPVKTCLGTVSTAENINLPVPLAERIAEEAYGNVRKALIMLEVSRVEQLRDYFFYRRRCDPLYPT